VASRRLYDCGSVPPDRGAASQPVNKTVGPVRTH
jgi:hypothetical protein